MLFTKVHDNYLRKQFLKIEHKLKINKYIKTFFSSRIKIKYKKRLTKLGKEKRKLLFIRINKKIYNSYKRLRAHKAKLVRHCLITNRTRSVCQSYSLTRNMLRELMLFGVVPGYKKAVW